MGKNLKFSDDTLKVFRQIIDLNDFILEYGHDDPVTLMMNVFKFDLHYKPPLKFRKTFKPDYAILPNDDVLIVRQNESTIWCRK